MSELTQYEKECYEYIKTYEPQISAHMLAICSKFNISLAGFDHRIKTKDSLIEKLHKRGKEIKIDSLKDICRYTMLIPKENYTQLVKEILNVLLATDQENIKFANNWNTKGQYQGINAAFKSGDLKYEIQFHTQESYMAKHKCHKIYEAERICKDPVRKAKLIAQKKEYFSRVPVPEGAMELTINDVTKETDLNVNVFNSDIFVIDALPILEYMDTIYKEEKEFIALASLKDKKTFSLTKTQIQSILENKITPTELLELQKCISQEGIKEDLMVYKNIKKTTEDLSI